MSERDYIAETLDAARSALHARDYVEASAVVRNAIEAALQDNRIDDAAALSSILATYLSLAGDDQGALEAYERAEQWRPHDPDVRLRAANHLFFAMKRPEEAKARLSSALLLPAASEARIQHKAAALLGRFALAEHARGDAITHLRQAHDAAASGDLDLLWWDLALPKMMIRAGLREAALRSYLMDLLARAQSLLDSRIIEEASAMLAKYEE
jgi:Tfp pilus assembly protein PilF